MKKLLIVAVFLWSGSLGAQRLTFGLDWSLSTTNKIKHDLINIDTVYNNATFFYIKDLKEQSSLDLPGIYMELESKNKFFIGGRFGYASKRYSFDDTDANGKHIDDFSYSDYYENKYMYTRLYAGKEFLTNKLIQPWIYAGFGNYRFTSHYFDNETDASLQYNFSNYINWLNSNLKSVNVLSVGLGFKMKIYGIYAYYDQSFGPLNQYMHSYSSKAYLVFKADILSKNISKRIKVSREDIGSVTKKRAYVKPNAFGFSLEHPLSAGFEILKDTISGFEIDYGGLEDPNSLESGYAFDGFLSVEIRKKAKMKFSPQLTMYYERSIGQSNNWFIRHALSYRSYKFIYEKAAKNYQDNFLLYLSTSQGIADASYNELDVKNMYNMFTNEHKIGYRFINSSKPNYFVVNAGIRMNWRVKHWNNFTSKVRFINPTANVGLLYKTNRFSFGVNGEHSIISPDKNKYYKSFYSVGLQLNYDIQRWDK